MTDSRVLVAYSSVHGSTAEIGRAVAFTLGRAGLDVVSMPAINVRDVSGYHAVVVGSAVYGGNWRPEADYLLQRFGLQLFQKDVWLFQSGPLGVSARGIAQSLPAGVAVYAGYLRVKGVATFGGKLGELAATPLSRLLVRRGLAGDYRDFAEIRRWAECIARTIMMNSMLESRAGPLVSGRCTPG